MAAAVDERDELHRALDELLELPPRTQSSAMAPTPDRAALLALRRTVDEDFEAACDRYLEVDEQLERLGFPHVTGCDPDADCAACDDREGCTCATCPDNAACERTCDADADADADADFGTAPVVSHWGSTVEAAAVGWGPGGAIARATLDRLVKRLQAAGVDPGKLPGGPARVGVGVKKVRRRWDLSRVPEFLAAADAALKPAPAQPPPARPRGGLRGKKPRRYGPADGRSPLARVKDPDVRG